MARRLRARSVLIPLFALIAGCVHSAPPQAQVGEPTMPTVEERKDSVMADLAQCESGQGTPGRGPYIGRYQFSTVTVINYVRERDGRKISAAEAQAIARDDAQASALAKYMIFERGGHANWPACSRKLGIPAKVAEINAI